MKETKNYLSDISLKMILHWIDKEKNPKKKDAFNIIKAIKLYHSKSGMDENLRVVCDNELLFEGFKKYDRSIHKILEHDSVGVSRAYAEYDNTYRQLVCNAILKVKDHTGNYMYGFLKRSNRYTEIRLSNSVGMIGGHCNMNDDNLYSCLIRELSEEIKNISFENSIIKPLGYIRLNNGTVSNQHLCILYIVELDEEMITLKSKEKNEKLIWLNENQLKNMVRMAENEESEITSYDRSKLSLDSWAVLAMKNYLK